MMRPSCMACLLALLGVPLTAQWPTERPRHVTFEFAVFWPSEPRNAPVGVFRDVGRKRHPELRFVDVEETAPDDIAVFAEVRATTSYGPPSLAHLKTWARGIRKTALVKVKDSPRVLVVRTSCPRDHARDALQATARLLEYTARRSKAWIWA